MGNMKESHLLLAFAISGTSWDVTRDLSSSLCRRYRMENDMDGGEYGKFQNRGDCAGVTSNQ